MGKKKSWEDITVADFQRIYSLEKEGSEERLLKLIALVNGIDYNDVLEMPLSTLYSHFSDIDFLEKEPKAVLVRPSYELGGTVYKIHTKELTTAQYIDFKQMVDTYAENLPRFLTIFLIPSGCKYASGYDLDKAAQDIGGMGILDAKAVAAFFLTLYGISTRLFLRFSRRRIRRALRKATDPREKEILQAFLQAAQTSLRHTTG